MLQEIGQWRSKRRSFLPVWINNKSVTERPKGKHSRMMFCLELSHWKYWLFVEVTTDNIGNVKLIRNYQWSLTIDHTDTSLHVVGSKKLRLVIKRSAGVAPEVNPTNPLRESNESLIQHRLKSAYVTRSRKLSQQWTHQNNLCPAKCFYSAFSTVCLTATKAGILFEDINLFFCRRVMYCLLWVLKSDCLLFCLCW